MQICLFHSTYPTDHVLREQLPLPDPERFVNQHTFHHRPIDKDAARSQIDAAVAEKFDFYFNFMWGQSEDEVAGVEATEYLESLDVPFIGLRSRIIHKCNSGLSKSAKCSIIPTRQNKASTLCQENLSIHSLPGDLTAQEDAQGVDYSVLVIEFGPKPIALCPIMYSQSTGPDVDIPNRFPTSDLVNRDESPILFDLLQATAIEAYEVNGMTGSSWGSVDIRIRPDGNPVVIRINPMPAIFLGPDQQREDATIQLSLPGSHRALLNIVLATYFMQLDNEEKVRLKLISSEYDNMAPKYDLAFPPESSVHQVLPPILSKFDLSGSLLDLGCGTGIFGRLIRAKYNNLLKSDSASNGAARHVGIDLSPEMARASKKAGYDQVLLGSIQEVLPNISERFDHISSYMAIHFVSSFELSLVLSRCFQIANKSVTIGVDEIPDKYNEVIRARKSIDLMTSINHLQEMRDFGVPIGWKLALEERYFSWKSPSTGVDVYTTLFHYQRDGLSC